MWVTPGVYVASDIFARFKRLKGVSMYCIPWVYDAFGLLPSSMPSTMAFIPAVSTETNNQ